jgi:hypothetical protein
MKGLQKGVYSLLEAFYFGAIGRQPLSEKKRSGIELRHGGGSGIILQSSKIS